MRARVWGYLKQGKAGISWEALVGYTVDDLRAHLEELFADGMTWETFGLFGWHIDHIRPVVSFDLTDPEQLRACWALGNLRPLWAVDNWRKGSRIEATDAA